MKAKQAKTSGKKFIEKNPFEFIGQGLTDSFGNLGKGIATDTIDQILNLKGSEQGKPTSGDLAEGEELVLSKKSKGQNEAVDEHSRQEQTPHLDVEPGIDYRQEILYGEKRIANNVQRELNSEIQEILAELQRIISSSKELEITFNNISTAEQIVNSGKYHKSFLKWLLTIVKDARLRVEDSGAWLAMFKSKKAKREYWAMFKKHGTTFGLSNERVVATQTG